MAAWLAGILVPPAGYLLPAGHAGGAGSGPVLVALAAIALTMVLAAFIAQGRQAAAAAMARPLTGRVTALREKSWSAVFQRQLNPDSAGRPRPRAPSAAAAAA